MSGENEDKSKGENGRAGLGQDVEKEVRRGRKIRWEAMNCRRDKEKGLDRM